MYFLMFLVAGLLANSFADDTDGGKAPRLALNDGTSIPTIGLALSYDFDENEDEEAKNTEVENAVTWALDAGHRLLDTASAYLNEDQIGRALQKTKVPREHIFVVTKLAQNEKRDVVGALRKSLERLNQNYVDLYLIHNPVSLTPDETAFDVIDYLDTWKGMEEAKTLGLARSIGISNFNISQVERLLEHSNVKPSVLQVEVNLNLAQDKLVNFCKEHNIVVMAYSPFGSLFDNSDSEAPLPRKDDPELVAIAEKYKKATPQIVLKYLVQRGLVPLPKAVKKEQIEKGINIFDFTLSDEDMTTLAKFNKNYRTFNPSFYQDHPYYPFEKVDKPIPNPFKENKE